MLNLTEIIKRRLVGGDSGFAMVDGQIHARSDCLRIAITDDGAVAIDFMADRKSLSRIQFQSKLVDGATVELTFSDGNIWIPVHFS